MSRIMAIDYGLKRVGLAVTDPLQIIATPLETVPTANIMDYLISYEKKEGFESIVLGWPVSLKNQPTDATGPVISFKEQLHQQWPGKDIFLIDERFTSKMAKESLVRAGMKLKKRKDKAQVDLVSATLILQSFLAQKSL